MKHLALTASVPEDGMALREFIAVAGGLSVDEVTSLAAAGGVFVNGPKD